MGTKIKSALPRFIDVLESVKKSRTSSDDFRFRLVSFNILAQAYVKSIVFPHSPSPSLRWNARSEAILIALKDLDANFFCLQEVDLYDDFYQENMKNMGYLSLYVQKSGTKRDGCGIFYKEECAELLLEEKIVYNDLANLVRGTTSPSADGLVCDNNGITAINTAPDFTDPFVRLKRDCVGIMAAFLLKEPSYHVVIVANTHLYWNPKLVDVKLAQAKYLMSRLEQFRSLISNKYECSPSLILSGDFNSTPGDEVYRYLVSGGSSSPNPGSDLPLCSVYAAVAKGEPAFTNCTPGFTGTLDYIFYSPSSSIAPVSFLKLPDLHDSDVAGGLPNYHHPSDHLPIGAEFVVTDVS